MKKSILSTLAVFAPVIAFAQGAAPITRTVDGFLNYLLYLASRALPLLILAALILLLWGIVQFFFLGSKDDASRSDGKKFVLHGIVALFVMVSVWGLVNVLRATFDLDNNNIPLAPSIPLPVAPSAQGTIRN